MGLTILTASDPHYNEGKISARKNQAILKVMAAFTKYSVLSYNLHISN